MAENKKNFTDRLGDLAIKIAEPLNKIGSIKGVKAVTMGLMATMPMTLIGSIFMLLLVFSIPGMMGIDGFALFPFFTPIAGKFMTVYRVSLNFLAFWSAYTIAQAYAQLSDFDTKKAGMVGIVSFLLLAVEGIQDGMMPVANFAADGLVVAMLSSVWMTKLYIFLERNNFKLRLPDTVPSYVGESFGAIIPMFVVCPLCWLIRTILNIDVVSLVQLLVAPISGAAESLPFYIFISIIVDLFWFCGLHGNNLTSAITNPLVAGFLAENAAAKVAGATVLPHIWIKTTLISAGFIGFHWVVVFLMMRSKVPNIKTLGRAAAVPMFFCVQEPLVFGLPLLFNSYLIVPWILTTIVNGSITWLAFSTNLISRAFVDPSWACPAPLALFLSTGDFKSLILVPVLFGVGYLITKPFFVAYEKSQLEEEKTASAE